MSPRDTHLCPQFSVLHVTDVILTCLIQLFISHLFQDTNASLLLLLQRLMLLL